MQRVIMRQKVFLQRLAQTANQNPCSSHRLYRERYWPDSMSGETGLQEKNTSQPCQRYGAECLQDTRRQPGRADPEGKECLGGGQGKGS